MVSNDTVNSTKPHERPKGGMGYVTSVVFNATSVVIGSLFILFFITAIVLATAEPLLARARHARESIRVGISRVRHRLTRKHQQKQKLATLEIAEEVDSEEIGVDPPPPLTVH